MFSANLQETLGISWYEGSIVNCLPMVPDRLSYKEMAINEFKYPSEWTKDFETYKLNKKFVVERIIDYMENYKKYVTFIQKQRLILKERYFSGKELYNSIAKQ